MPFHFQACVLGHDLQQGFTGAHHRTLGVHAEVDGDAIGRRVDLAVL